MTATEEEQLADASTRSSQVAEGALIAGKYRVERLLGMGGMGVVVAARHLDLDRPVAIKVVREELAGEERVLQRFLFEARSAAQISNEHVCKVIDVGRLDNGLPFIVMELLEGQDLGHVLAQRGRIEPVESTDWILQVCEGVAQAHAAGFVHRDLKPENVLLTQVEGAPCLKILDFGISKQLGAERSITEPHGIVGSPRYMAPEQLLNVKVDERSDIWAIGAIAYELVTGVPAFIGDTVASICAKVVGETPPSPRHFWSQVPQGLDEVILRCLQRDRSLRFRDVPSLALALAPFASERGRQSCQRIAAFSSSRRASLAERNTVPQAPLELEPRPNPTLTTPRRRGWHAIALLVPLACLAYGVSWWSDRQHVGRSAVTSPAALPTRDPAPPEPAPVTTGQLVPSPDPPAPSAPPAEPVAPAQLTRPAEPPVEARLTHRPAKTPANPPPAPSPPAEPLPPTAAERTKLQEAWDIGNFGGRQ